jgi:hypothetical protein
MAIPMMTDRILSETSFSPVVDVPTERIDIADWLFNLPGAFRTVLVPRGSSKPEWLSLRK